MYPGYSRWSSTASRICRPIVPPTLTLDARGIRAETLGQSKTTPAAEHISSAKPSRKRQRVSTQDLYQSISILLSNSFQKNLLQRDGDHIHRDRLQRARFFNDFAGPLPGQQRERTAMTLHPQDAGSAKRHVGSFRIEDQEDAPIIFAKIFESARDHVAAAINDRQAIGDLLHFCDLMGGEEHRHLLAGHMRHERVQNLLDDRRIEA